MSEARQMMTIEAKRRTLKVPVERLCSRANVGIRTYYDALNGVYNPRSATIAKLNHALHRFHIGFAGEAGAIAPHTAFKACVIIAAFATGADAKTALNTDPARRATADPIWLAAAKTRRIAFWIMNQWLGFAISDVARAAGVTKAAVSQALPKLEDLQDTDAELRRVMKQIEEIFTW